MKALILEDDAKRIEFFKQCIGHHELSITDNSKKAIEYLKNNTYYYIFLDNDLGEGNGEGLDVAEFLYKNPKNPNNKSITIIHSWNTSAASLMRNKLPHAILAPFKTKFFSSLLLTFKK